MMMGFLYRAHLVVPGEAKHTIHLETRTNPKNTRPNRLSESQKQDIERQVTNLLQEGIIVESNSPQNSPVLAVPKRVGMEGEQTWRLVIHFQRLNEYTVGDACPLCDLTETFYQLDQFNYFPLLNMVMGYHHTELEKGEGPRTALSTKHGRWNMGVFPLG
jgi:hypothetical protein